MENSAATMEISMEVPQKATYLAITTPGHISKGM
jgi:hypothetical protein